jgi:hypothetical protein
VCPHPLLTAIQLSMGVTNMDNFIPYIPPIVHLRPDGKWWTWLPGWTSRIGPFNKQSEADVALIKVVELDGMSEGD